MEGISLREISRKLGYSVSSLHEHQKRGRFKPLSDGSYDIGDVVEGLLQWSIPSAKHRSALEANKPAKRTKGVRPAAKSLTPAEQAAEDAAVAAVMDLANSEEVLKAVDLLACLPRRMLDVSQRIDPVPHPQNTLRGFERTVTDWLTKNIVAARDE
jgi:hypothetical protein